MMALPIFFASNIERREEKIIFARIYKNVDECRGRGYLYFQYLCTQ